MMTKRKSLIVGYSENIWSGFEEYWGLGTHLFVRYLDQETAKKSFWFSNQAATCYYQSNHSKIEAIPLSALP